MDAKKKQLLRSVIIAVAAALYLVSPIDIIPDTFLGFGQMDDLAVAVLAVSEAVKAWKLYHQDKVSGAPAPQQEEKNEKNAAAETIETTADVSDEPGD